MNGSAWSAPAAKEWVVPDAPPGTTPLCECTRENREVAGPFPENCDLYINGELVKQEDGKPKREEAPWIAWKEGWWYCIACSKYCAPRHQTSEEHLHKVGNWLWDHGYTDAQREAVIQSIWLDRKYSNSGRDSSGAEEAENQKGFVPKRRRCDLTPRGRDPWESWASASPGTTWPTNEETQALADQGVAQAIRFRKAMRDEFASLKDELKGVKEELRQLKASQQEENRQMKESLKAATEAMTAATARAT